jgi:DNA-binding LacI/PurR family transcriptional regulator
MTIQDVAERSGVFISTISRVVTGCIAVEFATAERVQEAIADPGFRCPTNREMGRIGVQLLLDRIAPERSKGHALCQWVRLST